jgi:hypothetical protein
MMLVSIPLCSLFTSNISILIVIQTVIRWCLFQLLCVVGSQATFQSRSSCKLLFNDSCVISSIPSALYLHFNLDPRANRYSMILVSIPLCRLLSSNISISIVIQTVIQWYLFQFLYTTCSQATFQCWSSCKPLSIDASFNSSLPFALKNISILIVIQTVIQWFLFQFFYAVGSQIIIQSWSSLQTVIQWFFFQFLYCVSSQSTFQFWSSDKPFSIDASFNSYMPFVLNQHFNLDRHSNRYSMLLDPIPLCRLLSINISILIVMQNAIHWNLFQYLHAVCSFQLFNLDRHANRYSMMLVSIPLCRLLSNYISISIVIQTVIQWCLFQFLYTICSQTIFQSWSSSKSLFNDACFNSSMPSALKQHFNLDRHSNRYSMMHVSIPLCRLISINISILIVMETVIHWCLFQFLYTICSQTIFQSRSSCKPLFNGACFNSLDRLLSTNISISIVMQTVIHWCLLQYLCAVCSLSTFQSWSSCKPWFIDACFNISMQFVLFQLLNLDHYANPYSMMPVSIPHCRLFSTNISILIVIQTVIHWCLFQFLITVCFQVTFQSWSSCKTLFNDACFTSSMQSASTNLSMLIVMQTVIQLCLFQFLIAVCFQIIFQYWSSSKTLFIDACFNSSMPSALNQHFNLDRHTNLIQ